MRIKFLSHCVMLMIIIAYRIRRQLIAVSHKNCSFHYDSDYYPGIRIRWFRGLVDLRLPLGRLVGSHVLGALWEFSPRGFRQEPDADRGHKAEHSEQHAWRPLGLSGLCKEGMSAVGKKGLH